MRERLVVLLAAATLCVGIADAGPRQEPETRLAPEVADRTRWQPWRAPADTPLSATQEALRADLIRHIEETVAVRRIDETFPLSGDLLAGRTFWAAVVLLESYWRYGPGLGTHRQRLARGGGAQVGL